MSDLPNLPDPDDPDLREDCQAPPRLYHYTDAKGFFGIVKGKVQLRATHFRFLNDLGEVTFGAGVVVSVLEQLRSELGSDVAMAVERKVHDLVNEDSYFACLSERHDVLSQWRAYADSGAGYCIALRPTERLVGHSDEDGSFSDHLVKCTYGEAEAREWLVKSLLRKLELARALPNPEGKTEWLVSELAGVVSRSLCRAKHDHFREEREWRRIVSAPQNTVDFRVGTLGLTPYLLTEPMILEEVWTGPRVGPDAQVAKRTVERFLAQHNLGATVHYWASTIAR